MRILEKSAWTLRDSVTRFFNNFSFLNWTYLLIKSLKQFRFCVLLVIRNIRKNTWAPFFGRYLVAKKFDSEQGQPAQSDKAFLSTPRSPWFRKNLRENEIIYKTILAS